MKIVPETEELVRQRISEARQLSIAAPIIIPLLEKRKHDAYMKLLAGYRDGRPLDQNQVAIMFVVDSLQREIHSKLEDLNLNQE